MIKLLIQDTEIRDAIKEEIRAVLVSLGRSEAQSTHQAAIEKALASRLKECVEAVATSNKYGPYGEDFKKTIRDAIRADLLTVFRAEVSSLVASQLEAAGGIEVYVQKTIGGFVQSAVAHEFKKIKEAGEVFQALKGAVRDSAA